MIISGKLVDVSRYDTSTVGIRLKEFKMLVAARHFNKLKNNS